MLPPTMSQSTWRMRRVVPCRVPGGGAMVLKMRYMSVLVLEAKVAVAMIAEPATLGAPFQRLTEPPLMGWTPAALPVLYPKVHRPVTDQEAPAGTVKSSAMRKMPVAPETLEVKPALVLAWVGESLATSLHWNPAGAATLL